MLTVKKRTKYLEKEDFRKFGIIGVALVTFWFFLKAQHTNQNITIHNQRLIAITKNQLNPKLPLSNSDVPSIPKLQGTYDEEFHEWFNQSISEVYQKQIESLQSLR